MASWSTWQTCCRSSQSFSAHRFFCFRRLLQSCESCYQGGFDPVMRRSMWTASTKLLGRCAPFGCLAGFLKSCSTRLFPSTPHTLLLRPARLSPGTDAVQPRFSSMCISVHRRSKKTSGCQVSGPLCVSCHLLSFCCVELCFGVKSILSFVPDSSPPSIIPDGSEEAKPCQVFGGSPPGSGRGRLHRPDVEEDQSRDPEAERER